MSSAVVPNGRPHDHESGQDRVAPAENLEYEDTVAYPFEENPDATQPIPDPRYIQDATTYTENTGYTEVPGYSGEPRYPDPGYGYDAAFLVGETGAAIHDVVIARQEDQFGGIKIGSAFFGWLAAAATAVLLTAVVIATGTAAGLTDSRATALSGMASSPADGTTGIIILLLIVFFSFFSGGYVAGRMARFNGAGQGLMVWLWAVITAGVVAALSMVTGTRLNISPTGTDFPGIPLFEGQLTTGDLIAIIVAAAVALMGAALGGTAGMRYHRKVDRAGFTPAEDDNVA